jgi:hypothetical protein
MFFEKSSDFSKLAQLVFSRNLADRFLIKKIKECSLQKVFSSLYSPVQVFVKNLFGKILLIKKKLLALFLLETR